jgi:hypothetical protein
MTAPGVALALAAWLRATADKASETDGHEDSSLYPLMLQGYRHPLAVARAVLGEEEDAR